MSYDWGIFKSGTDGLTHVVPVTDKDKVRPPHVLRVNCPCGPTPDEHDDTVLIHHTEH